MSVTGQTTPEARYDHLKTGRTRAAIVGLLWSLLSGFAPAAIGALVFLATSRALGPAEFGTVALAATITTIASALVPVGFGDALVQRAEITRDHLDTVFWLCFGVAALVYAGVVVAAVPFADAFGTPELKLLIPLLGLKVFFDLLGAVPNALLTRAMAFQKLAVRTTIASLAAAAICIVLLLLNYGLWALAFSQLASSLIACAASMLSARWAPRFSFRTTALRDLSRFGLFSSGQRALQTINLEQVLIGSLLGTSMLGLFSFARRIFQLISDLIASPLNAVSYPLLSSLQKEPGKLRDAYIFATLASSIFSFPLFIGMAAVADDLIPIAFGDHWGDAVGAVRAFCAMGLLTSVGVLQSSLIRSQGQAGLWLFYMLARQAMTILYIIFFHNWGLDALVTAIAIQSFLMWLPAVHMVMRLLNISLVTYFKPFVAPALAAAAMFVAVSAIKEVLPGDAVIRLLASIGGGALVYIAVLALAARSQLSRIVAVMLTGKKAA
ncbi:lipopolysaccharide biosynthesis protein [Devosia sp. SL43]|uniref:lipopolysaccharide biosynthesis protein n=1 Tax=Devosia sp. SL43 TaxID=2806348 RepID=UPI001F30B0B7|nr:lipopolysaccharide biosynthesis protein [Devosia sp. SL43]UJW87440.1 lipopolysaccharide biosynthesis protein [Devosia sp. SL43]